MTKKSSISKALIVIIIVLVVVFFAKMFTSKSASQLVATPVATQAPVYNHEYTLIKWDDLIPAEDLDAILNAPLPELEEGSEDDSLKNMLSMNIDTPKGAFEHAMMSTKTIASMDKAFVKLPGFIVPLDIHENGITKEFFFVPYFGACLHLPPPPPNQIVYARFEQGIEVGDMDQPYYIQAQLFADTAINDMATAAYTAQVHSVSLYTDPIPDGEYDVEPELLSE